MREILKKRLLRVKLYRCIEISGTGLLIILRKKIPTIYQWVREQIYDRTREGRKL
ncbi:MAG: hypothetical protein ACLUUO_05920 [Sellimonas intestinalis]